MSLPPTLFLIFNYSPSCNHFVPWSYLPSLPQSSIPLPFPGLHPLPLYPYSCSFLFFFFFFCHSSFTIPTTLFASIFQPVRFEHMIYSHRVHATRRRKRGTGNNDLSGKRGCRFRAKILAKVFFFLFSRFSPCLVCFPSFSSKKEKKRLHFCASLKSPLIFLFTGKYYYNSLFGMSSLS